jgi:hypothetical protein
MRTLRASFVLRRIGSYRLVLGAALLTTIVTAALTGALASFAAQALPQAVRQQLAVASGTSVKVTGALDAQLTQRDARAIATTMRAAFGSVPFSIDSARWSDPLGLAGRVPGGIIRLIAAAAPQHIQAQAALTAGAWPGPPVAGQPLAAAVPAAVARSLRLAPGQVLVLRDRDTGAHVRLRLTGIFRQKDPASAYWGLNLVAASGISSQDAFVTYGPVIVNPAAFTGRQLAVGQASWVIVPRTGQIADSHLASLAARLSRSEDYLRQSPRLSSLSVTTDLPHLLLGTARSAELARSLLAIGALQLALLAAVALALAASLLASQREGESALLSARGGTRWQLARLGGAESVLVAGVAVAAGVLLGTALADSLLASGPLRAAALRITGVPVAAWLAAGAVGLLCAALLLRPAFRPAEPGTARVRHGRRSAVSGIARTGGDVAIVLAALVSGWQLRRYSAIAAGPAGGLGVDPVLTVAPVLALAGGTLILVRLLPVAARIADRAAARSRRLGVAMASWEISRRPVRQGASVLLVVLAVATSTLALAQHQSWRRSAQDQASFSVGADVRVDLPESVRPDQAESIVHSAGVLAAMPVAQLNATSGDQVLALGARQAPATVLLRSDLSPLGARQLWSRIEPAGPDGLAVPGRPAGLEVTASLGRSAAELGPEQVTVIIEDAAGVSYELPAGSLPADGRSHHLVAILSPRGAAAYPVRLTGLTVSYTLPARRAPAAVLTVSGIAAAAGPQGPVRAPFASGRALGGWQPQMSAIGLSQALAAASFGRSPAGQQSVASWRQAGRAGQALTFDPGYGTLANNAGPPTPIPGLVTLSVAPVSGPVPGIATGAYLAANDVAVGQRLTVTLGNVLVPVRIVAEVAAFPTVSGPGGGLIVSLTTMQALLTGHAAGILPVSQWWLRTSSAAVPRMPAGAAVTSRQRTAAALVANPMSAVPQQALVAIAAAAVLLAALGFSVSVTASVRERRAQSALLAALGVSRAAQAALLCLEELMLSLPAAAAGLLLGAAVARLLILSVTLTATATLPVPPVLIQFPWLLAAALALAVAAVPVIAAALTVGRRPDPAAQLRASEAA